MANIFDDLASLRLDPATSLSGTVEHLGHVPVRKPGKVEFFRTHPDPDMSLACSIFADDDERETYFIVPQARPLLLGHLKPVLLIATISRQGTVFLWPVSLPNDEAGGGRGRAWGETARQAADDRDTVDLVLSVLACALGPLTHADLAGLCFLSCRRPDIKIDVAHRGQVRVAHRPRP